MQEKKKILVVDDEPDVVEMLQTVLETASYEVVTAYDGKEAIEKTRKEKPDAIILDLMMPGVDGFAASKELKGDSETSDIPILVLTAFTQKRAQMGYPRDMGLQLETEDYISKPIDPKKLLSRLKEVLKD